MLFRNRKLMQQQYKVYDTQLLSQLCPKSQQPSYLLLGEKLQQAKDFEEKLHHMNDEDHEWEKLEINLDCTPHNTTTSKYIIVRHALAWHNYFKRATEFRDRNIYSYDLMDPPLHYLGRKQCEKMRPEINQMHFDIVYISPLLRTVQTAQLLFCNHPNKDNIKFILCPQISEKISSQYSIYKWGNLTTILNDKDNPLKFDMSEMPQELEFWQFILIDKLAKINGLQPTKQDQEFFLVNEFVRFGATLALEKNQQAQQRANQFVDRIKNYNGNAKIGIVSHSQIIKQMLLYGNQIAETKIRNGTIIGVNF